MNERKQKAEEAARAMGWEHCEGEWYKLVNAKEVPCAPDLDDWRFIGAMIKFIDYNDGPGYIQAVLRGRVDEWPDALADAVIAQAKREAKR